MHILIFVALLAVGAAVFICLQARKGHAVKTPGEEYNVTGTKRASERLGVAPAAPAAKAAPSAEKAKTAKVNTRTGRISRLAGKKTYGAQADAMIREGEASVEEMLPLQSSIQNAAVQDKVAEIIRITDKILDNATEDPSDVSQSRKFFHYYLPTTIKLLNSYQKLEAQGIEGENISKGLHDIEEMLDVAADAFRKRLDSLFANQSLDIETEIDVMNQMLKREGLINRDDINLHPATTAVEAAASAFSSNNASAQQAQAQQKG